MSKFFYSGEIKQENVLSNRDVFLNLIYGKWFNILIAGLLFISYGIFTALYFYFLKNIEPFNLINPDFIKRLSGFILIIMGSLFFGNYLYNKYVKDTINKVLKYRGIFDVVYGILILIFLTPFSLMLWVFGVFLFSFGLSSLLNKKKKTFLIKLRDILAILIGISLFIPDIDLGNYIIINYFSLQVFTYSLIILGCYLIYLSFNFRKSIKAFEDEEKGFTDYKIE